MDLESFTKQQQASLEDARRELRDLLGSGRINPQQVTEITNALEGLSTMESETNEMAVDSTNNETQVKSASPPDDIVGLEFTNGRILYCHRSTLVNAGGYFAACFGEYGIPTPVSHVDERGRNIYFMEGDGDLFARHILPFILRKIPGRLPPFFKDPELWRQLRSEALSYVMDDLLELLFVTHSCPYVVGDDRGVLHWLGTSKGKELYRNPHAIGAVNVNVGGLKDITYEDRSKIFDSIEGVDIDARAYTLESRQALVQYRPAIVGYNEQAEHFNFATLHPCYSLWCELSNHQVPTVVDLRTVRLRLTAYSLRYDGCGMTDWNLEGSKDGDEWTILHEARNDQHIASTDPALKDKWSADVAACNTIGEKVAVSHEFAERERRHAWQITPSFDVFYRFFRIIGSGSDYERDEEASNCLHGVGLELYGDVHED